ncbi:MAG: Cof-type HAD-IIB family hydrolase [Lachnospiraceae bacterium]|nr:Cof-type HAD-IIB family hydrolase [Lachnospiraceae bacterium]
MIRLIASDVDGTLVKDGSGSINPEYYEVISALCDKGIVFCIASGRQYASVKKLFAPVADRIFYIAEGGSVLRGSDEVYHIEALPQSILPAFLEDCRACPDTDLLAATPEITLTETGEDTFMFRLLVDSYGFNVKNIDSLNHAPLDQVVKISLFNRNNVEEICDKTLIPKWKDQLQLVCSGKEWIDCISLDTNKGRSLKMLQQRLGISKDETMVFGDNMNDLAMFSQARYSYAIGNARDEVKKAAAFTADTYSNNGVLKELKKLLETM